MKVLLELTEDELTQMIGALKGFASLCKSFGQADLYHTVMRLIERLEQETITEEVT